MALRFNCKGCQISQAGTVFSHNLGGDPTQAGEYEWFANLVGPNAGAASLYRSGTPTSSQMTWVASGATGTGDVFISRVHTVIR